MYPFTLRRTINISKLLRYKKNLLNNDPMCPAHVVNVNVSCKALTVPNYDLCVKFSSQAIYKLPKDPKDRKIYIDEVAQQKLDAILSDPENEKKKKILELEILHRREEGEEVPSVLRTRDWAEILLLNSPHQQKKFLRYLFLTEKKREKHQETKLEKSILLENHRKTRVKIVNHDEIEYGIGNNFLIRRVTPSTMNKLYIWNCLKGHMFGNKIIFDCSFGKHMNSHESKSCARQFLECYAANRQHNFPFDMHMCNVDSLSPFMEILHRFIPTMYDDDFPINISTKSYLDLFDKKQLVYLSPNSRYELTEYNPNAIYIIGAIVDKGSKVPISRAKAHEERIKSVKLPLDRYIRFGDGSSKDLTLNQVFSILLDLQISDWKTALKHVPLRKTYQSRILSLENKVHSDTYARLKEDTNSSNSTQLKSPRKYNTEFSRKSITFESKN